MVVSIVVLVGSKALTKGPLVCVIIAVAVVVWWMFLLGVVLAGLVQLRTLTLGKGAVKGFLCCHVLLQFEQGIGVTCNVLPVMDECVLPLDWHHSEVDVFEVLMGEG